ncbi:hypothetical protein [Paenibacillus sp. sgz302251]|uniref:hypothetical protein n=1 Tax=Paenibacillus sp. sgz302251 TaxID=3414493 RepID=UPI003C7C811D
MRKAIRRFCITIFILILLLGGAVWWLLSYIAPDEELDMTYASINVREKAMDMIQSMRPELVLTEADINNLIKMHLAAEGQSDIQLAQDVNLDGASFELEENRLIARMNATYMNQIPAQLNAVYALEWQDTSIALRPQSLSVKDIGLPLSLLEPIIIPLDLPARDMVTVSDVEFQKDQIVVRFKVSLELPF